MNCGSCGTENRPDRKFCLRCGAPLAARCPSCGASNEPDAAFCGECGTRLRAAGQAAGDAAADAVPQRAAPVAERRLVSVLFADLVGYTTVAEGLDAEDARDLLDRYFAVAREIVQRYGGAVEKFIGDAVMAVWGTPTAHEDDAERAVRAAMDLTIAIPRLVAAGGASGLRLRAGVLTGEAAVNLAADGQAMVAGDLVNIASRLQSVAEPGSVFVGEATMRSASRAISFEPAGEQQLKGREAPVPAWRALAVVARVRGAGRSDVVEPPFVGREAEFSALKERLHATSRDHRARLVSISGVGGIGKSRLAWELEKYLDGLAETVYWHHGRSPAYGSGLAFWALGEMVRRRAGIAERDDEATTNLKLDSMLRDWVADDEERRWVAPRMRALLGLEEAPAGSREELFAAWRSLFERISDRGTAVLVFEDLHWADDGLVDFIESILEWSRAHPILIVTLARPELLERRSTWGAGQRDFTALHLEPLGSEPMTALVHGMAPGLPASVVTRIVERSEGIPLYAVELFRMLVDGGQLVAGPDGYRAASSATELDVPPSLHALIAARLDALPPAERRLLQDASVLGKTFTIDSLAAVVGESPAALEPRLRSVVRRELLTVDVDPRSPERGQYGFIGSLIREVAYATLARRDRRERHLAAARYFETLGDDELAGMLASHYTDAFVASAPGPEADAVGAQARIALRAAAERSFALASPAQAAGFLRRALSVTTDEADSARLHEDLARAEMLAGEWVPTGEEAAAALQRYEALGDRLGTARAASLRGEALAVNGKLDAATETLERALAGLPETGGEALGVELRAKLARVAMFRGRPFDALPLVESALATAAQLDLVETIADLIVTKAWALSGLGRQRESNATLYGAIAMAQEENLRRVRFRAINNLAATNNGARPREMLDLLASAMTDAERLGDRDWADKLGFVALVAVSVGDWDYAETVLAQRWRDDQPPLTWLPLACARATIDVLRGRTDEAARLVAEVRHRVEGSGSVQDAYGLEEAAWYMAYADGRMTDAGLAARRLFDVSLANRSDPDEPALLLGVAAGWNDDMAALQEAKGLLRGIALRTQVIVGLERCLDGALAARDGRPRDHAARLYAEGIDGLRRVGHELWAVLVEIDAIGVLPATDPVAKAGLEHARAFAASHGAVALSALIEQRLERRHHGTPGQPSQPARTPQNVLTTS